MDVVVLDDVGSVVAHVAGLVLDAVERQRQLVLGVATGATPLPVYRALARGSGDLSRVRLVALDEYVGLPDGHPSSYAAYVAREVAAPLGIRPENVLVPKGSGAELERRIAELGGVDLQLLGIGRNGHLAFNEPGSALDSRTRVVELSESTRAANAAYVEGPVPTHAVTQGLGTILEADELLLLATGAAKAPAVAAALTGPVTTDCPASVVQRHPRVTVVLDAAAASMMGLMADEQRVVSASLVIEAPAEAIWELIVEPAAQPSFDGNENLASAAPGQRVRAVGDVFRMTLSKGAVRDNHVVEFDEGRRIAWRPAEAGGRPFGQLWRWELEPRDDGATLVTHTYDWAQLTDESRLPRARATQPENLMASLDRLASAVGAPAEEG